MTIKLIASDLDGTLLHNGAQSLGNEIITYIERLADHGILFAAASGRQYPNLKRLFEPVKDKIAYICENGALVIYQDTILSKSNIDRELGLQIMEDIYQKGDCEILLSGQSTSYVQPKNPAFAYFLEHIVHNNVTVVKDFHEVKEPFYKISAFEQIGIAKNSGPYFMNKWSSQLSATFSGFEWLDFMHPQTNKGNALQALCDHLHISTKETMAFGDNFNDIEMLTTAGYGYAMSGANEEIKALTPYTTHSVEEVLRSLLEELEQ
ncbi:HAD family hydrolase [Anaerosporobacter faecicola]|uniref:HAD family hydrolase n=1 Tax=Anaerosporobacter faecicola TaxID=2718714 RepID=UPI001439F837|nr:HAD family hydrolase [Anaerosporobacter faecicola]